MENADRTKLKFVKEVGGMPFILFEYYLTWQDEPGGIKPSLEQIAADLGLKKSAVCNLRTRLVKAGWILYENDEVFIKKSFTKNESDSQNVNDHSQKMNDEPNRSQNVNESFTKNESELENGSGTDVAVLGFSLNISSGEEVPSEETAGEPLPTNQIIPETEKAIGYQLDIPSQTIILGAVPLRLKTDWINLVNSRMIGKHGMARNYILSRIGYWLSDFQRDFKKQIDEIAPPPVVPTMTMEEKKARFAKQSYNRPRPEIYVN